MLTRSPSTKSLSGSDKPPPKWRLESTLKRKVEIRAIEKGDVRYLWAAYKQGALAAMESFPEDLTPEQFKTAFEQWLVQRCHGAWTLSAKTKQGFAPVGVIFGAWSPFGTFWIVIGAVFMPWASKRNILEAVVGFITTLRKEYSAQFYALLEHKRLYEVCAAHGLIRRVGTSYIAIPGKTVAIFENKKVEK